MGAAIAFNNYKNTSYYKSIKLKFTLNKSTFKITEYSYIWEINHKTIKINQVKRMRVYKWSWRVVNKLINIKFQ